VSKKKLPTSTTRTESHRLKGKRKGAKLREHVRFEDGRIIEYSLAYINLKRCSVDNGRVLGYDNRHGYPHRHFMGKVTPAPFETYPALLERFILEVHELWRVEDEESES
jgi:hypothetical protein